MERVWTEASAIRAIRRKGFFTCFSSPEVEVLKWCFGAAAASDASFGAAGRRVSCRFVTFSGGQK